MQSHGKIPTLFYLQVVVQVELTCVNMYILLGTCLDSVSLQPQRLNDWVGLEKDDIFPYFAELIIISVFFRKQSQVSRNFADTFDFPPIGFATFR